MWKLPYIRLPVISFKLIVFRPIILHWDRTGGGWSFAFPCPSAPVLGAVIGYGIGEATGGALLGHYAAGGLVGEFMEEYGELTLGYLVATIGSKLAS